MLHSEVRMAPDRILREQEPKDCDMDDEECATDLHIQYHGHDTGNTVREHITCNFSQYLLGKLKLNHTLDRKMVTCSVKLIV